MSVETMYKLPPLCPKGSAVALLVAWLGLILFTVHLYKGTDNALFIAEKLFGSPVTTYMELIKRLLIVNAIVNGLLSLLMTMAGYSATKYAFALREDYAASHCVRNLGGSRTSSVLLGVCYVQNLYWLTLITGLSILLAMCLGCTLVCIPQDRNPERLCLNFTWITKLITGGEQGDIDVHLELCGRVMNHFCVLGKGINDWFWQAYFGTVIFVMSLSHFNATLASNYARITELMLLSEEQYQCDTEYAEIFAPDLMDGFIGPVMNGDTRRKITYL